MISKFLGDIRLRAHPKVTEMQKGKMQQDPNNLSIYQTAKTLFLQETPVYNKGNQNHLQGFADPPNAV